MILLDTITLPITDPVLKFLLILLIILFIPLLLNKLKIPHLIGLIIAGAVVGPFGFNLMERDSSIILSGTAGLLYIMFLAGLEIDLEDFKKNSQKSIVFGLYTFCIPMILGYFASAYLLNFSVQTSILLASMFASHTLIAYPIISKYGITKNQAVNVTVGGTIITDTLSLLVLAAIVGMQKGNTDSEFWVGLSIRVVLFIVGVIIFFPIIGRWFFKRVNDGISQYIFVLAMVFLGAFLADLAGIEGIIGAFLAGITLNNLISQTSSLMNRISFVGNAIFIPFFLISVGMLVDYRVFFKDFETIKVAAIMTGVAITAKYLAAWLTQKTFKYSVDERKLIFGLSNAQAAATLAAVTIGHKIILNQPEIDAAALIGQIVEPVRLLNDSVLNGTIIMILVTCTIASIVAQKGAKNIVAKEEEGFGKMKLDHEERILIPINRPDAAEHLINLAVTIKSKKNKSTLYALNIMDNSNSDNSAEIKAKKILERATVAAAATEQKVESFIRYDINIVNGIMSVVREHKITDLILGLHVQKGFSMSFLGSLTDGILNKCNTTTMIYKRVQPIATIKRHLVLVPEKAEEEIGFPFWLIRVWNLAINTTSKLVFYATKESIVYIKEMQKAFHVDCEFIEFYDWNDFFTLSKDIRNDDNLLIVLSRRDKPSYNSVMSRIPSFLNKNFQENSFILIYPMQEGVDVEPNIDFTNPTMLELERLSGIGKIFGNIFSKKKKKEETDKNNMTDLPAE